MRTDKKVSNSAVVVSFDSSANSIFVRKPGREERENYENLVDVHGKEIRINSDAAHKYGMKVVIVK